MMSAPSACGCDSGDEKTKVGWQDFFKETFGPPFYINTEAPLPLVRALTIARWRVIAIVVTTLWLGATAFGYFYNAALALGWM